MKSPYVSELQPNQVITALFWVQHKDIRQKKTGDPYLSLILSDRTGELEAKMWDNAQEVMDTFEKDDFLKVRGLLQVFQNRLQLTVHKLQKQEQASVDLADFFPASKRDPEEMLVELLAIVEGVQNPHLQAVLKAFFTDRELVARYKTAPAAKTIHHAYLGGLLEHVLSLCGLARLISSHYTDVDLDLLTTGVLLHDVGKIYELTYDRSFGYSNEGQLLGHIIIGLKLLDEKIRSVAGFPARLRTLLEHMILSHHGELEFGSPKVPLFTEALILHHIDNLDSKMECMRNSVERDRQVEGCWTGYISSLERPVLKKSRYMTDGVQQAVAAAAVPVPPMQATTAQSAALDRSRPTAPLPPPAHQIRRPNPSMFGEKLQSALRGNE